MMTEETEIGNLSEESCIFHEFTWKIPLHYLLNFKHSLNSFVSPTFNFAGATWCFRVLPAERMVADFAYCEMVRLSSGIPDHNIYMRFGIMTNEGFILKNWVSNRLFQHAKEKHRLNLSLEISALLEEEATIASNGIVIFFCHLQNLNEKTKVDPSFKEELPEPVKIKEYDNSATCDFLWSANFVSYHCQTCAISPNMALCPDCFQSGNHVGHDFSTYQSPTGGFCDCGDKRFMRESGFCQRHGPHTEISKLEDPPDLLSEAEVLLPKLIQHLRENSEPVRKSDKATICGLLFSGNYLAFRCRTCAVDSTMSLCLDCFRSGNHDGHDFSTFKGSSGGYCDCGDKNFLKESGFCPKHGPQNQSPEASVDLLPAAEALMPRLIQHLRDNSGPDLNVLCQNLKSLLLYGDDHNVTLLTNDKKFRAHQCILKARSDVLSSMLTHDMIEKNSGIISIPDCDPKAFKQFLLYLYTGKVETLDRSTMLGLYYIADKYNMMNLKEKCCTFIKKSLSSSIVCDVIQLALNHSDTSLLSSTTNYFVKNISEILRTVEWQSFLMKNTTYANELLIKAANKWDNEKTETV